jgi:hypothetical protein
VWFDVDDVIIVVVGLVLVRERRMLADTLAANEPFRSETLGGDLPKAMSTHNALNVISVTKTQKQKKSKQ